MSEPEYVEYSVGEETYHVTLAEGVGTAMKVPIAVYDANEDIHYKCEEADALGFDMPTATVPGGEGIPEDMHVVPVRMLSELARYIDEEDREMVDKSLTKLTEEVLGKDSRRSRVDRDSRKARKKARIQNWQGLEPENMSEEDYPTV
ncbi:MAG: hypothetical protein ABEK16_05800 [Candidatus Nanohalobium sp.]